MNLIPLNEITYNADTSAIKSHLYPKVKDALDKPNIRNAYKKLVNDFIAPRAEFLYDTVPCNRLICSEGEMDKLFDIMKIPKAEVKDVISQTYYGNITNFKPLAAKHEFTVLMVCIIRYFMQKKMNKEMELAMIHLAFSGKFYPSIHYGSYPTIVPVRNVMEYVVNNCLTKKFDLTVHGNILGAVKSVGLTWLKTYEKDKFKDFEDGDIVYIIQQLHSRIGSFMKNIAVEYYDVYDNKDMYLAYQSDSYDPDDFHLADSDTLRVAKFTELAVNSINFNGIDYKTCKMCSNDDITPNECKAVLESIVMNKNNISTIKELVSLMISLYFASGGKDLSDIKFINFTVAPKPNAKQKEILRCKEIIQTWLEESGTAYMRRRSRIATRNAYERAVRLYFALLIHNSCR